MSTSARSRIAPVPPTGSSSFLLWECSVTGLNFFQTSFNTLFLRSILHLVFYQLPFVVNVSFYSNLAEYSLLRVKESWGKKYYLRRSEWRTLFCSSLIVKQHSESWSTKTIFGLHFRPSSMMLHENEPLSQIKSSKLTTKNKICAASGKRFAIVDINPVL